MPRYLKPYDYGGLSTRAGMAPTPTDPDDVRPPLAEVLAAHADREKTADGGTEVVRKNHFETRADPEPTAGPNEWTDEDLEQITNPSHPHRPTDGEAGADGASGPDYRDPAAAAAIKQAVEERRGHPDDTTIVDLAEAGHLTENDGTVDLRKHYRQARERELAEQAKGRETEFDRMLGLDRTEAEEHVHRQNASPQTAVYDLLDYLKARDAAGEDTDTPDSELVKAVEELAAEMDVDDAEADEATDTPDEAEMLQRAADAMAEQEATEKAASADTATTVDAAPVPEFFEPAVSADASGTDDGFDLMAWLSEVVEGGEAENILRDLTVTYVSGVEEPAIDSQWVYAKDADADGADWGVTTPLVFKSATRAAAVEDGEAEEQKAWAPVLIPDETDKQGDVIPAPEIERAAHNFLSTHRNIDTDHSLLDGEGVPIESWTTKDAQTFTRPDGTETREYPEGTWMMGVEFGDEAWERVKAGDLTGFSMYGEAEELPVADLAAELEAHEGEGGDGEAAA